MFQDVNDKDYINKLISVLPTERQMNWQKTEYYNFIHFGTNTFTGKEWGDGKASPSIFNPDKPDTDQWCRVLKASGSKGVIITAKHHDGFCLFPSEYTDYCIKNSPYKGGKGDIVKELSDSAKKYGLKLGVYLSPWDRHEASYGTDSYNDYFCNQLTELLTNYGEIFCVWFDGACGEGPNGKKQIYDFERYYALIRKLQPNAVISICGPDVRWIGNEGGNLRKSEFSVLDARIGESSFVAENSQQADGQDMRKKFDTVNDDLGSREFLLNAKKLVWYPAEMDVSITLGWFWSKTKEFFSTRSLKKLLKIYLSSVGHNSSLLLNIPVNSSGLIPKKFERLLKKWKAKIDKTFSKPLSSEIKKSQTPEGKDAFLIDGKGEKIKYVTLMEDIEKFSQRIEKFEIYSLDNPNAKRLIFDGTTVGYKQICKLSSPATRLEITISECRDAPKLLNIHLFK